MPSESAINSKTNDGAWRLVSSHPPRPHCRKTLRLLKGISDSTGDAIFAKDREGSVLRFANPATLALIGISLIEQVLGKTDAELLEDVDAAT